jgi:catechol 2,3-dioxygenase-like lactoylglutathione lyase family enzyme
MIGNLSTITLIVKDMDRSVAFYRDVLGLKVQMHTPFWSGMDAGNIIVGLHPESEHSKVAPGGGCTFGFEVTDIQKTAADLKAKDTKFLVEPKREDFGWLAVFADPDGYSIVLAQTEAWAKPA